MSKEKLELLIEGGNAKPDANIAQKLGPMKIPINEVMSKINEKTISFKGMKVPVKVFIDPKDKTFELVIGFPPVTDLIKKELSIEKGSPEPNKNKIYNMSIEQIIKIAKMKKDSMLVNSLKSAVKNIIGSAGSMGILVEGKNPHEAVELVNQGFFDNEIDKEKTETTNEKKKQLEENLKTIQKELQKELEKEKALEAQLKAKVEEKKVEAVTETAEAVPGKAGEEKKPATGAEAKGAKPETSPKVEKKEETKEKKGKK